MLMLNNKQILISFELSRNRVGEVEKARGQETFVLPLVLPLTSHILTLLPTLPKCLGHLQVSEDFQLAVCGCWHCLHLRWLDCGRQNLACSFYLMQISLRITPIFLDL